MTEETQAQSPEQTPPQAPGAPEAAAGGGASKEVEEGKVFAILAYALSFVGLPFFLVPLIMRNNDFSLYHAKQCLILWLAGVAGSLVSAILMAVCIGAILLPIVTVFCLVLNIIGLINAVNAETKPLPIIGKWGEDWFKGIRKV